MSTRTQPKNQPLSTSKALVPTSKSLTKTPASAVKKTTPSSTATKPKPKTSAPAPTGNWVNQRVQNTIAGAGSAVGSVAYGVGNGVSSVGRGIGNSIASTTRYWGQGVAGYGNDIKDAVRAGGPRVPTAGNPLGIGGMGSAKGLLPGGKLLAGSGGNVHAAGRGSGSNPLGI
ncbi:hypothetical protein AAFC00_000166 [Neodothiora populina]|uniref:Uncharacterized protein n=1 Tax=Neodothiora populina TaxID=2781224 RepID=A0ABR3P2X6_9PEZI